MVHQIKNQFHQQLPGCEDSIYSAGECKYFSVYYCISHRSLNTIAAVIDASAVVDT